MAVSQVFFLIADTCFSCEDIARQSCAMVRRWRLFGDFLRPVFYSEPRAARFFSIQTCIRHSQ